MIDLARTPGPSEETAIKELGRIEHSVYGMSSLFADALLREHRLHIARIKASFREGVDR